MLITYKENKGAMSDIRNAYIAILTEDKFDCIQLILWGWFRNLKLLIINSDLSPYIRSVSKYIFFINRYIKKSIQKETVASGKYKGLWYEINKETIDLTLNFYTREIINNSLVSYYNKILYSNKFEAYIKKTISYHIFDLLGNLHIIQLSGLGNKTILLNKTPVNEFVIEYMERKFRAKYRVKWVCPFLSSLSLCVYYGWLFIEFAKRGFVFNKRRKSYKFSKEAWGLYQTTIGDDTIIDDNKIKASDILMLNFAPKDYVRVEAFKEAKKRGFDAVSISSLEVNINKNIFNILFFYIFVPVRWYLQLTLKRRFYLFYYLFLFHKRCFPVEVLMNLFDIKCHISTRDVGDVEETIILNKYRTKNTISHWSDLTTFKSFDLAFIAHNFFFAWGNIHYDYHSDNYFIDKKINIGCIFKEGYKRAVRNKRDIITQTVKAHRDRKIVTFFDNSFNNTLHFTEHFFLEYLEIIEKFCKMNRDVNILLKRKSEKNYEENITEINCARFKEIWNKLTMYDNFNYIDSMRWGCEEIIAVSDVCVSMGISSPSTVALICGKDALYFDNTGNKFHPFARKYKDRIIFEDKNLLLNQIENILNSRFNCKDIISEQEIREYDAFDDDNALERLRDNLYELASSVH